MLSRGYWQYFLRIKTVKSRKFYSVLTSTQLNGRNYIARNITRLSFTRDISEMQALQFDSRSKELTLISTSIPEISDPRDVLVKVAFSGVCGTDLHIIQGEFPCRTDAPVILGHEFSGIVADVGSEVKAVKKGDKVAIDPNSGCNVCSYCHTGCYHFCKNGGLNSCVGIWRNGGMAEFALVPENQIYKLPDSISPQYGALLEPLSCIAHGFDRVSPVSVGKKILIMGAGIAGKIWANIFHYQGHKDVTISEAIGMRRNLLGRLDTGYEVITPEILKGRQQNDPEYLFDIIVDCTGYAPAVEHAFTLLNRGGKLCIYGCSNQSAKITISPFDIFYKEISVFGSLINPYTFEKAIGLMNAMGEKYVTYEKLAIETYKLSAYENAMNTLKKGDISKAVFAF